MLTKTLEMQFENVSFAVKRSGQETEPLKFLREFTQNSIEACLRNPDKKGEIWWDIAIVPDMAPKLMIVDTGDGMSPAQMKRHLTKLYSSGGNQADDGNFGVGAKIAGLRSNPYGVEFTSWQDRQGYQLYLHQDENGKFGAKPLGDDYVVKVPRTAKIEGIESHGTSVVFMGNGPQDNTLQPPEKGPHATKQWITHYLNSHYFAFPDNIAIHAIEGNFDTNRRGNFITKDQTPRDLFGQKFYLDKNSDASGTLELTGAKAHWWVLKEDTPQKAQTWTSTGHVAALYQNELYEVTNGRKSTSMLQEFGVSLGSQRVAIYVEPDASVKPGQKQSDVTADTARKSLLIKNEALPWTEWAREFRDQMPHAIAEVVENASATTKYEYNPEQMRKFLEETNDLFDLTMRRSAEGFPGQKGVGKGKVPGEVESPGGGTGGEGKGGTAKPRTPDGVVNIAAIFAKTKPANTNRKRVFDPPEVHWLSAAEGTRPGGYLDNVTAHYLPETNQLHINRDTEFFDRMIKKVVEQLGNKRGVQKTAEAVLRYNYTGLMLEVVRGAKVEYKGNHDTANPRLTDEALSNGPYADSSFMAQRITNQVSRELHLSVEKRPKQHNFG